jgi:F0F1-type ATP synthase membrane subunit b/b'
VIRLLRTVFWIALGAAPCFASAAAEGGHEASLPWKGFIFTVLNFAILVWLIAKPIKKALSEKIIEKHRMIKAAFDEANAGIAKSGGRLGEYKKLIDDLPREIAAIEKEAREEIEREKIAFAQELAAGRKRIEDQARELADQEIRAAHSLLVGEAVAAIAVRTEQLVAGRITPAQDRDIVAAGAAQLGGK